MTRKTARQIAVQLLFSMETNRIAPNEATELFFSEEHYGSLSEEDEIYRELPDTAQVCVPVGRDSVLVQREQVWVLDFVERVAFAASLVDIAPVLGHLVLVGIGPLVPIVVPSVERAVEVERELAEVYVLED